jgi:hypothetical protein
MQKSLSCESESERICGQQSHSTNARKGGTDEAPLSIRVGNGRPAPAALLRRRLDESKRSPAYRAVRLKLRLRLLTHYSAPAMRRLTLRSSWLRASASER